MTVGHNMMSQRQQDLHSVERPHLVERMRDAAGVQGPYRLGGPNRIFDEGEIMWAPVAKQLDLGAESRRVKAWLAWAEFATMQQRFRLGEGSGDDCQWWHPLFNPIRRLDPKTCDEGNSWFPQSELRWAARSPPFVEGRDTSLIRRSCAPRKFACGFNPQDRLKTRGKAARA